MTDNYNDSVFVVKLTKFSEYKSPWEIYAMFFTQFTTIP